MFQYTEYVCTIKTLFKKLLSKALRHAFAKNALALSSRGITYHQSVSRCGSKAPTSYHLAGISRPPKEPISEPICSHCQMLSLPPHRKAFFLSVEPE